MEEVAESLKIKAQSSKKIQNLSIKKISDIKNISLQRIKLGIGEWDNALGGGIVPGQVILLAGEPGVGKSTLLLTIAEKFQLQIPQSNTGTSTSVSNLASEKANSQWPIAKSILYFAGEESVSQISGRASRMGLKLENTLFVESETDSDSLIALIEREKPDLVMVDSVQTLMDSQIASPSGSLAQVRSCAQKLTNTAKKLSIPILLVGHINKEGNVAGPKVLEHIVDTNLFLEGEKYQTLRFLRVLKNRFGPVDEVGLFEMTDSGLQEVADIGKLFMNPEHFSSGSCLAVVIEGTRPMLVEVQALTLPCKFGYPKRSANGVSLNRLQTLLAVIEKRLKLNLQDKDVYVSLAGGLKINEPALDLPLCLAIISAIKDINLGVKLAAFGEVGLGGEVRSVVRESKRAEHGKKLGIANIVSAKNHKDLKSVLSVFN